ncbi:hypothetical protein [Rhodoferax sp.]|uniref:hypothetical protein n=1 Tax=Rhodoferax sp. TaxID=50421 RepID=UPI0027286974|nr:hypothetical protein [Rhodoferax sp.]MDO9196116.1 hypothetical protein [Rhodoferax sp.]
MYSFSFHWLVPVALTVAMPMALAQPSTGSATPDSKSAAPSSVTLSYRSAFADYRAYSEQPVASWREANDKVDQIGGWRAYAREASQPEPVTAPASGATGAKP